MRKLQNFGIEPLPTVTPILYQRRTDARIASDGPGPPSDLYAHVTVIAVTMPANNNEMKSRLRSLGSVHEIRVC